MRVAEENRRDAPLVTPPVRASIDAMLKQIDHEMERVEHEIEQLFKDYPTLRRQRELLISIPGIAETTAARILGEMPNITEFRREDRQRSLAAGALLSRTHGHTGQHAHP
jgi:transposase